MPPPLRMGVVYDFRNPPESGMRTPDLYAAIMAQVEWLDRLGIDLVWFTEHHFVDDGYLPSWIPVASAMAARTKRVRFSCDVCLLPFNHPIRLAEDLAVLDNISGGRVEIGVGLGYAVHEFRGFGLPVSHRLSYTDEGLEVLTRAFTGERFSFRGKRYDFQDVRITPGYVQPGGPPLWVAALAEAGAARAARFGANLLPQGRADGRWTRGRRHCARPAATRRRTVSASSAPAWSPTIRSAIIPRSARRSGGGWRCTSSSGPIPAGMAASPASPTSNAFRRIGSSAIWTTASPTWRRSSANTA
jgi:alkanesulfonate monooxygenase SsuD/methylene tetrahydromethanopterin reductase-like flavin-dependent oxidoreductase (luciferase family)